MNDKKKVIAVAGVGLVLVGAVAFILHRRSASAPAPMAEAPVVPAPVVKAAPPPAAAPEIPLPELGQSDEFMRARLKDLSTDRRFASWLKIDNLVRRAAVATDLISAGKVPSDSLSFLAPRRRFSASTRHGKLVINPRSYARYDGVANVLQSIDSKGLAALFQQTRPLFQQACQELGDKTCDYRDTFVRAVGEILETPVADGDLEVAAKDNGIIYTFADSKLEQLDPVQKELLRMGPDNEKKIQAKLREISAAIGVGPDQLPQTPSA